MGNLLNTKKNISTALRFIIFVSPLYFILQGCALFHPPCGADCEANHICNALNTKYINDDRAFTHAKRASNSELVLKSCVWRKGLILPKGKDHWVKLINPKIKASPPIKRDPIQQPIQAK